MGNTQEQSLLHDIGLYKNRLINVFLNNSDICQLLLDEDNITSDSVDNLVYSQVFPYLFVDNTQTQKLTYLCIEIDVPKVPTRTIKDLKLTIWAYCHKDCMKYSQKGFLGTRVDILSDMIERTLQDSNLFGIGKLHLDYVTRMFPQSSYYGREMVFSIPDFKYKEV